MTNSSVDETDRRILSILQTEGRITNLELAERVGLSPTPCSRRVKRLEEDGVIMGYGARINPTSVGQSVSVMVQVRLSQQSPADIEAFMSAVHRLPEITECLLVTGNLDYVLKVQTADVEALRDFVLKELKAIPCVSETSTMLILDVAKSSNGL
ncbi:Leucine-responsive regulatory protein [Roseovarius albus]|uniref:Leucine-responsive regulatory protein n=1 Tax=Roseovarius albus TaxID=1247867 RepID=A0A1X6Y7W1_9RHOB|nr:Lrp/AsnC family transcriptional regulator [Roseovarius albus]SLN13009.1 Leucine-responsive regulatory protein [Roseovarius albus]